MKRSALKPGKPMARTAFKQKAPAPGAGLLRIAASERKARKAMKSSRPKSTPIRRAAKGQDCTLRIPGVCNFDPATTVLCHSNLLADGKGMGLKAPDEYAAFGCASCHDVLDGRRQRPDGVSHDAVIAIFIRAVQRTHEILRAIGLIKSETGKVAAVPISEQNHL